MEKIRRSILMGGGKTLLLGFALIVIALAATGCEQPDKGPVAVDSITISSELQTTDIEFEEGRTFKLTADIQPDNATDKTVVWSSDDEGVATVSDDGTVTIKGVGNVTITAEAGGKSVSDTFVFYEEEDLGFYFNETENTYYIWDERGLLAWNAHVMQYTGTADTPDYPNLDTSAKLMADISLEGISWTPVGYYDDSTWKEYYYAGTFDGGGHIISNLKIDSSDSNYLGLFAYIATGGVVENLTLSDVAISGYEYIGGIAGYNRGTIENCSVSGSVSGTYAVGGIVGNNNEIIENCSLVEGSISGDRTVGGIVGYNVGTIEYCNVESGSVSGTYDAVGGIVGDNGGTISACNNKGKVSGTEAEWVGGIAGYSYGKITACYNTGSVSGNNSVGGIVGYNENGRKISACYNTGNVLGFINIGGIAGANYGTITACYWSVPEGSSINYDGIGSGSTSETVKKVGSNGVTWEAATSAMNDAISDWNKENSNKCDYQFVQNDGESEPPVLEKGAPATT